MTQFDSVCDCHGCIAAAAGDVTRYLLRRVTTHCRINNFFSFFFGEVYLGKVNKTGPKMAANLLVQSKFDLVNNLGKKFT